MTSLLTNTAAMVALRTLNDIGMSLNETNNRVSTGLRIAEAKDSAAYWAIATTTTSDNGALAAVTDALKLGTATLNTTYAGLDAVFQNLTQMRNLLAGALEPTLDKAKIQNEIDGLIADMQNKASASTINEENFLAVDTTDANYNATKSVLASFTRASTGISLSTIDIDLTDVILTDAGAQTGILDVDRTVGGSTFSVVNIDISALTSAAADVVILDEYTKIVDAALQALTTAMTQVGVNQARASTQLTFIQALMDANKTAVGALIDANMEEESTKLRALQTQQQLSVESLSIANTSSQNILSLFR